MYLFPFCMLVYFVSNFLNNKYPAKTMNDD